MEDKSLEITAQTLLYRLRTGFAPFLLDTRNSEDYESWKFEFVPPKDQMNIPYIDFIEGPEEVIPKLPKGRDIIVLCAKGGASNYVADILRKNGFYAVNVAGGMKGWGATYIHVLAWEDGDKKVIQFNRIGKGCLSYILVSGEEAAIIDPSRHIEQYISYLLNHDLELKHVFDTHLHADHLSGGAHLSESAGAEYHIGVSDIMGGTLKNKPLSGGEVFKLGASLIEVMAVSSPGHTPGSITFLFDGKVLFTGDTLFLSSMGRPDLGGHAAEWAHDLWNTIMGYGRFGDDILVMPSHTSGVREFDDNWRVMRSLGMLRKINPLLTIREESEFIRQVIGHLPPEPEDYQKMRNANMGLDTPDDEKKELWELGKNRCAVATAH